MSSLLLSLLVLHAAADVDVQAAERAYDEARYREVFPSLSRALARPLSDPDRLRAYELLGFVNAAFDEEASAVEAFRLVLGVDPAYRLEPGGSPKVISAFERARTLGPLKAVVPERIVEVQLPPPPPPPEPPVYKRWWFWTGAAVVVVAGAGAAAYAMAGRVPRGSLGTGELR